MLKTTQRILKNDKVLFGLSNLIFLFTLFIVDVFVARTYTYVEVAQWKQIVLLIQLSIPLFSFGTIEGYRYAIRAYKNQVEAINGAMLLTLSFVFLLLLLLFSFTGVLTKFSVYFSIDTISDIFYLIPFLFVATSMSKMAQYLNIDLEKHKSIFKSFILWAVLFCILLITLVFIVTFTLRKALVFSFLLAFTTQFIYLFVNSQTKISFNNTKGHLKKLFTFGIPLSIATYIGLLTLHVDKSIVNTLGGTQAFAIYAVGAFELPFNNLIVKSVTTVSYPKIVQLVRTNYDAAVKIWLDDLIKITYITFPVIILLIIFAETLIITLFGEQYRDAIPVFRAYCLILVWRNSVYGTLLSAKAETKSLTLFSGIAFLLNIILAYAFYHIFGIVGVIYATFVSITLLHILIMRRDNTLKRFWGSLIERNQIIALYLAIVLAYIYFQ